MIANEQQLDFNLERIRQFQSKLKHLRGTEKNATNYRMSASGFLAEIDRMQLEIREYLSVPPVETQTAAQ